MPKEIERKFLVKNDSWRTLASGERITQAYLAKGINCVFRVRIRGDKAWLTIKGKRNGISGDEFEYEIPLDEAQILINSYAECGTIEKMRYCVPMRGFTWEVDQFSGENQGLVIAEIELADENQDFPKPDWLGLEVSADPRYANFNLAKLPFSKWKE